MAYNKGTRQPRQSQQIFDPITRAWLEKAAKERGVTVEVIQYMAVIEWLRAHIEPPPIAKAAPTSLDVIDPWAAEAAEREAALDARYQTFPPLPKKPEGR
ncbi:hypothetical protein HF680_15410 [Brevundimonas sp. WCHBH090558]|uniref:hypothetical protein n=1 Tax=Brevundimonas huaxiensis TaxID=2725493 RepID=UPI001623C7CB|nr:hypothetical protein [Brevundimonas huaxiensis]MBC1184028.1 hypothetical protein [Brevundimonas huaxiensis]